MWDGENILGGQLATDNDSVKTMLNNTCQIERVRESETSCEKQQTESYGRHIYRSLP